MCNKKKLSLWNSESLYVVIPEIFIVRPIQFLLNSYLKPMKFLVLILPRKLWKKGNNYIPIICMGNRMKINASNICCKYIFAKSNNH